jgi:predicted coiled-coil protein
LSVILFILSNRLVDVVLVHLNLLVLDVYMDLQNKYQILASEFSKVRGQVTVLKKAVLDEQSKNQQIQVNDLI